MRIFQVGSDLPEMYTTMETRLIIHTRVIVSTYHINSYTNDQICFS